MKSVLLLLMLTTGYAFEASKNVSDYLNHRGIHLGIGVISQEINEEYKVEGVLVLNTEGFELSFEENKLIELIPTDISVSLDGEKLKVYTDLATMQYWGSDDLVFIMSTLKYEYNKDHELKITELQTLEAINASATRFFTINSKEIGAFDFYLNLNTSILGKIKAKTLNDGLSNKVNETILYGAGVEIGVSKTLIEGSLIGKSSSEVLVNAGQKFYHTTGGKLTRTYIGLELHTGQGNSGVELIPYINMFWDELEFGPRTLKERSTNLGIELKW